MLVTTFSPFPPMLSEGFFLKVAKSRDCVVKKGAKKSACHNGDANTERKAKQSKSFV